MNDTIICFEKNNSYIEAHRFRINNFPSFPPKLFRRPPNPHINGNYSNVTSNDSLAMCYCLVLLDCCVKTRRATVNMTHELLVLNMSPRSALSTEGSKGHSKLP